MQVEKKDKKKMDGKKECKTEINKRRERKK
jgi:hypothetical protein